MGSNTAVATCPDAAAPKAAAPYSPNSRFELGQFLLHRKFGDVTVTAVSETWVEVTLTDGSKKRLVHTT